MAHKTIKAFYPYNDIMFQYSGVLMIIRSLFFRKVCLAGVLKIKEKKTWTDKEEYLKSIGNSKVVMPYLNHVPAYIINIL